VHINCTIKITNFASERVSGNRDSFLFYISLNLGGIVLMAISYLTGEGLQKLKDELEQLMKVERPGISRQIAEARDKGDLSENAEYDAAKEAQGMLEARISKLENIVANSRVIDESRIDTSKVQILNRVKIKNLKTNAILEYILVAEQEANLKEGKLSVGTPIAKGLIGKKLGDVVEINVPSGKMSFEIMEISK
jgi:transcription elongation factor GreA